MQYPSDLPGLARIPRQCGDLAIGGDFSAGNGLDHRPNSLGERKDSLKVHGENKYFSR
jgi:hypothetical protein